MIHSKNCLVTNAKKEELPRNLAISNRGMDVPDLSSDITELLCGKRIRLFGNRNSPDLSYKSHLKHSTLLDCMRRDGDGVQWLRGRISRAV